MRQWDNRRMVIGVALCLAGATDLVVLDLVLWPRLLGEGEPAHVETPPRAPLPGPGLVAGRAARPPLARDRVETVSKAATAAMPSAKPVSAPSPTKAAVKSTALAKESTKSAAKSAESAESRAAATDGTPRMPVVRLAASVPFGTGRSRLTRTARASLRRLLEQVRVGDARLRVEGHTDSRGTARHNRALARARARSVIRALEKGGISADRIDPPVSHGSQRPLAKGRSAAVWAQNRRVEIFTVAVPRNTTKRM